MVRQLFSIALFMTLSGLAAQSTIGDGNWSDPGIWDTGVPGMSDVTIGHNVTLDITPVTIANLTIDNGVLTIGSNTLNASTIQITSDLANTNCELNIDDGIVNVSGDVTFTKDANNTTSTTRQRIYIAGTGALNVINSGNMTVTYVEGGNESVIELHLRNTAQLNVAGNLWLEKTGGAGVFRFRNGNNGLGDQTNVTVGGDFIISTNNSDGGSVRYDQNSEDISGMIVTGDLILDHLNNSSSEDLHFEVFDGAFSATNLLAVSENTNAGANINMQFGDDTNNTSSTITFTGSASFTLYNDMNAITERGRITQTIEEGSTLSISNNLTIDLGETDAASTVFSFQGLNSSTTTIGGNLTINMTDRGSGTLPPITHFQFLSSSRLNLNGNLVFNSADADRISTIELSETAQMFHEGTINFSADDGANPVNDTFEMGASCTLTLQNNNPQFLYDRTSLNYTNVVIDKPSGGVQLSGSGSVTITGSMQLNNGVIDSNGLDLIFSDNATATSVNGYVAGPVTKIGDEAFVFPVGKGTRRGLLEITAPNNSTDEITVEYFDFDAQRYFFTGVLEDVSTLEYWTINAVEGATDNNISIQLYWDDQSWSGIQDHNELYPAITTTNTWQTFGRATSSISGTDPFPGSVTSDPISMGTFTVAETVYVTFGSTEFDTLPVEFLDFDANEESSGIRLHWSTASELNNDHFEIQRSINGKQFEIIGSVQGNGTTNDVSTYSYNDTRPLNGMLFYRLRQVDYDGQFDYSKTIQVFGHYLTDAINVYPNPVIVGEELVIDLRGLSTSSSEVEVKLMDLSGRVTNHVIRSLKDPIIRIEVPNINKASSLLLLNLFSNGQLIHSEKLIIRH